MYSTSDNKNTGKLFSKYKLHFLHQANSSSDPSQMLMLQFSIPRASLPHLRIILPNRRKRLFNTILVMLFIGFPILSYTIRLRVTECIGYTKPYANTSQSNLISSYIKIIIPYGPNMLPIKKLSL